MTADGRSDTDIKKRIATAKTNFIKTRSMFNNTKIGNKTKLRVLKTYVWAVMRYECETWTISQQMMKRLEAAEMWFIRRILKIAWTERVTNKEVLERAGTSTEISNTILKRQLNFLGHVMREGEWENVILTGKIEGK